MCVCVYVRALNAREATHRCQLKTQLFDLKVFS